MKILYSGGGTLGPVSPLLAIHEMLAGEPTYKAAWIGTASGPEEQLISAAGICFHTIPAGKFRRYASLKNITDIGTTFLGVLASIWIIWKEKPDLCISAGGFVSVPVHIAAWLTGVPSWVHQQDVRPGLANKLMMPFAKQITTVLKSSLAHFPPEKTVQLGNPIRTSVLSGSAKQAKEIFDINNHLPTVLVVGGGTGAEAVNMMTTEAVQHLDSHANIIHVVGKTRSHAQAKRVTELFTNYRMADFLGPDKLPHAYALADVVVTRGGFGSLTELAALKKAIIVIPKPGHQEENVTMVQDSRAGLVLDERLSNGYHLAGAIKQLLSDERLRRSMGEKLHELYPPAESKQIMHIIDRMNH